jgi:hypothetical protein
VYPFCFFIQLTGARGSYRMSIQLQDETGAAVSEAPGPAPEGTTDPVEYYQIYWRHQRLKLPRPGHYALVLLADGEEIGRHSLEVALAAK